MSVRVKICGITRLQDALLACALGADALGFVFYRQSPRYVSYAQAAAIIKKLPPFVTTVGLFVNPTQAQVDAALAQCPLDRLQFHGDESADFIAQQERPCIKAVAIAQKSDLASIKAYDCPVLLDAKAPKGVYGGTGLCFDWSMVADLQHKHACILAGGLNSKNISQAMSIRLWYAVDVSSGVETEAGIKSSQRLRAFFATLKRAKQAKG